VLQMNTAQHGAPLLSSEGPHKQQCQNASCVLDAGHINFNDEVTAGLRLADGVLLVVDAVEGVMLVTDKVVRQAAAEGLPICLLLSKVRVPLDTTVN
jgi:predicted membrane GTPase involved in stress response